MGLVYCYLSNRVSQRGDTQTLDNRGRKGRATQSQGVVEANFEVSAEAGSERASGFLLSTLAVVGTLTRE